MNPDQSYYRMQHLEASNVPGYRKEVPKVEFEGEPTLEAARRVIEQHEKLRERVRRENAALVMATVVTSNARKPIEVAMSPYWVDVEYFLHLAEEYKCERVDVGTYGITYRLHAKSSL